MVKRSDAPRTPMVLKYHTTYHTTRKICIKHQLYGIYAKDILAHNLKVAGSNPAPATNFPQQIEGFDVADTALTQETAESESANVKYPKRIKHRGRLLATIYGKSKGRDSYRVAWRVAGQRRMASFVSYALAKRHADALVRDLASGSQVTALNPAQARDALAALERLADFYRATGRRVSLLAGISEFVESSM